MSQPEIEVIARDDELFDIVEMRTSSLLGEGIRRHDMIVAHNLSAAELILLCADRHRRRVSKAPPQYLPAGRYRAWIIGAAIEEATPGTPSNGRCLRLSWQILAGPYRRRVIYQHLNMWWTGMASGEVVRRAEREYGLLLLAMGKRDVTNTDELLRIPCCLTLGDREAILLTSLAPDGGEGDSA